MMVCGVGESIISFLDCHVIFFFFFIFLNSIIKSLSFTIILNKIFCQAADKLINVWSHQTIN
jgi:hypothetical protein